MLIGNVVLVSFNISNGVIAKLQLAGCVSAADKAWLAVLAAQITAASVNTSRRQDLKLLGIVEKWFNSSVKDL